MSAADLFFGAAFAGGTHDEAAGHADAVSLQNALQPKTFLVARDLARNAHMLDRRHVDHVAAGQGDVRGDARALLPSGSLAIWTRISWPSLSRSVMEGILDRLGREWGDVGDSGARGTGPSARPGAGGGASGHGKRGRHGRERRRWFAGGSGAGGCSRTWPARAGLRARSCCRESLGGGSPASRSGLNSWIFRSSSSARWLQGGLSSSSMAVDGSVPAPGGDALCSGASSREARSAPGRGRARAPRPKRESTPVLESNRREIGNRVSRSNSWAGHS